MDNGLIQIDTGYACAGIIVKQGIVCVTAPIFKWMKGKRWDQVKTWRKIKCVQYCEVKL